MVDGFIHKLRATGDCHEVWVCSSTLGKPEINLKSLKEKLKFVRIQKVQYLEWPIPLITISFISVCEHSCDCAVWHFPPTPLCLCHYTQICRAATYTFSFHHPNLKLIHDLANALATGANDASMDPAVQGDVLRDHLFQLIHDGLNGISCSYGFVLIPCNSNLILWRHSRINLKKKKHTHPYTKHLARYRAPLSGSPFRFNTISHRHTWFSSFFSGNWMLTSCSVRMFVIMAPLRPIILGWYLGSTVMVSLKLLSACRGFEKRWQNVGLEFHKVWQLAISHYYSTWCLPKIRLIIKPFVHLRIMIRVPFELIWKD